MTISARPISRALAVALFPLAAAGAACPVALTLTPEVFVHRTHGAGPTDFIFTGPNEILVANLPGPGSASAPLAIYSRVDGKWSYDAKASAGLPETLHARHLLLADLDGDGDDEVVVADHGTDKPPYAGAPPVVLERRAGRWHYDERSRSLGTDFTFNTAPLRRGTERGLYKANVYGKNPHYFELKDNAWVNRTDLLPPELGPHNLCLMTSVAADFDRDGEQDMFLGGCDTREAKPAQTHDRILAQRKRQLRLLPPETLPKRRGGRSWGTVFAKPFDEDGDGRTDLLTAAHDYGFHTWKIVIYRNRSRPGAIAFTDYELPLAPEPAAEGYVNSLEDVSLGAGASVILAEVRSVLRDPKKRHPAFHTRLIYRDRNGYRDASDCLPKPLRDTYYVARKDPGTPGQLLLVPFRGSISSLKITGGMK
jgi:hypothetical protein